MVREMNAQSLHLFVLEEKNVFRKNRAMTVLARKPSTDSRRLATTRKKSRRADPSVGSMSVSDERFQIPDFHCIAESSDGAFISFPSIVILSFSSFSLFFV